MVAMDYSTDGGQKLMALMGEKNNKEVSPLEHFLLGRLPYLGR
jgi:hypothetical protein